jgi:hypothetical protein
VWRKHWVDLLRRAGRPALMVLVIFLLLAIGLATRVWETGFLGWDWQALLLGWLFLLAVGVFWLWYEVTDYRNDLYVLTEDRIIDIIKKPLALQAQQREGGLERVQTVDARQNTFWANLLDYGDVIIRTAAADEGYDFLTVAHPKMVQAVIFQRLAVLRRKQREREMAERQREIVEGLEVYHQLREEQRAKETGGR